jgi:RecJ-like exonuclease
MDWRDVSMLKGKADFDEKRMVLSWEVMNDDGEEEVFEVPAKFELCPGCQGKGTCVNPDIDRGGLSREDFEEDPDFEREYHSGFYDIDCPECYGRRVVPVADESRCAPGLYEKWLQSESDADLDARERLIEREMGY